MKKLVFTAIAVIAFSGVAMANNCEVSIEQDCGAYAATWTNLHEQADHDWYGFCYTSEQYNLMYNYYYSQCNER